MENHHAIKENFHYFDWAIFNSFLYVAMLVHQRVADLISGHQFTEFVCYLRLVNPLNQVPVVFSMKNTPFG